MPRADRTSDEAAPQTATSRLSDLRPGNRRKAAAPTVVLLVRHGTTTTTGHELPGRAAGLHLSDTGREQAERVALRIARTAGLDPQATGDGVGTGSDGETAGRRGKAGSPPRVAAVYASPLERTRETAAPIARLLGQDVLIDEGLVELDVGDWTGLELKAARKRKEWATIQRYPSGFTFPGGESFVAMQARITGTLDRLRAAHPGQAIVAVSHADPIRAAVAHAMGTHLDLFQRVVVSPCSLTAIAYTDEGPTVLTVNDTGDSVPLVPS
ncbi:MAG TPA: histidine phosphatase family protein [Acidimicrobiales bacterium]|nr:histidine phosphatase family protein [Acidimicrobiales bacterium]